jgi:hypothetical protein
MTNKRKRPSEWWEKASTWSRDCGGVVHSAISVSEDRELFLQEGVAKDTILLEIPLSCLPSCDSIQSTDVGKKLGDCIASLSEELFNEEQDLLLALLLAHQKEYGWEGRCDYRPYLGTLPSASAFDFLPRRWSDENKRLLQGSSLLQRVEKASAGLSRDYQLLSEKWSGTGFPSLETFDVMLAAVTSRAFAGMGASRNDQDISMVPLVDLCNHRRGSVKKNLAYRRLESSVQATALEPLEAGTTLQITYGAKGNAQLLFNYGFAIANNVEPDGSSNDVVEVQLKDGCPLVQLRTGPKSYTFGCFSKAIEQFHEVDEATAIEGDGPDDLEDFLNECEANPGVCGIVEVEEEEEEEEEDAEVVNVEAEITAIQELEKALVSVRSRYHLKGAALKEAAQSKDQPLCYAGIVILSELRTIQFYELACLRLIEKLTKSEELQFQWAIEVDDKQLQAQAIELADTFIRIRCIL